MPDGAKNKATLLEFYRLFYNEKRFDEGALLLAPDFINRHASGEAHGRQRMIDDFGHHARTVFPDFHIEPKRMAADGDFVWVHSLITGLPKHGRAVTVDIWRFASGAIAEHWDVGQSIKPDQDPAVVL